MRIAIDGYELNRAFTGVGRYLLNLLEAMLNIDGENEYTVFLKENSENSDILAKFDNLETAAEQLHEEGKYLIGTSPHTDNDIYTYNFTQHDTVIVFGTESSGLTRRKLSLLDNLVKIPMSPNCKFLTLPTAVPIAAYEFYRQIRKGQK